MLYRTRFLNIIIDNEDDSIEAFEEEKWASELGTAGLGVPQILTFLILVTAKMLLCGICIRELHGKRGGGEVRGRGGTRAGLFL